MATLSSLPGNADLRFGPFRLDLGNETLRRSGQEIPLTPKAFSVLSHLAGRSHGLVTKRELLDAIWPEAVVGDAVLKVTVREIRRALGDDSRAPSFIETIHRKGYRFIHDVNVEPQEVQAGPKGFGAKAMVGASSLIVGRDGVLLRLHGALEDASRNGRRRLMLLRGEAGMGKTTVADAFSRQAEAAGALTLRGCCVDGEDDGEGLLPLLEAIGEFARREGNEAAGALIRRYAPSVLLLIPWLVEPGEREAFQRDTVTWTAARRRRELADLIEAMARSRPVVLVIEDLHWSDAETRGVLSLLVRRLHPARLMILGTERPGEDAGEGTGDDLWASGIGTEMALGSLSEGDVHGYLEQRLGAPCDPALAISVFARTGGCALFVASLVEDMEQRGAFAFVDGRWTSCEQDADPTLVPRTLRQLVESRVGRLPELHQRILRAGSVAAVAGPRFSTASVAAVLGTDDVPILEDACESLCRRGFLRSAGILRFEGECVASGYEFGHVVYRDVLYASLSDSRRLRAHLAIVERGADLFGERRSEFAHEMAVHYEAGRKPEEAVVHWRLAARAARERRQHGESLRYLARALQHRDGMAPDVLLDILAERVSATRAQGDWEASERCLSDVLLAARATGRVDREVDALLALASVRFWTDRAGCLRTAEEAHALADARGDPDTRTHARGYKAHLHLNLVGWDEEEAAACDRALLAARTDDDDSRLPFHLVRSVWLACLRSQYVTAESLAVEACVKARSAGDASEYLLALFWRAWAALHQGRWDDVLTCVEEGVRRSEEDAHRLWACLFTLMRAHLLLEVGHLPEAEEMVDAVLAVVDQDPNGIGQSGFLGRILRARIQVRSGRPEEASATLLALDAQISTPTSYLDTILELPLDLARAEVASALHRPADATSLATELLHRAQGPGERTYAGLAYALLATLHHTAGDHRAASHAIASALTLCDSPDGPCPLALLSLSRVPNAPPSLLDTATRLRASLAVTLRSAPELVQAWTDPTLPPSVAAPPAPSEQAS